MVRSLLALDVEKVVRVAGSLCGARLVLDVLRTSEELEQGYRGHFAPGNDEGKLFVFPKIGPRSFWMKDVPFDLEILAFDSSLSLIHQGRLKAMDETSYRLPASTKYVLELKAGWAHVHKLQLNSKLNLSRLSNKI